MMVESYYQVRNGCKKHNDCFTCPFPDCRAGGNETNGGSKEMYERKRQVIELTNQGLSTKEVALKVGLTDRQVRRIRFLTRTS